MRKDAYGMFWRDLPPRKKVAKIAVKRVAPEPVWLKDDYLPGLEEAKQFPIEHMTDQDLAFSLATEDPLMFDIEVFPNYFLAIFRSYNTGKIVVFEEDLHRTFTFNAAKLEWILKNFIIVTFNGINFDIPITTLVLDGAEVDIVKTAADDIIKNKIRASEILKRHKVHPIGIDHIDLFEVAPLFASLKSYGGRLHVPRIQDLPFHPDTELSADQMAIVRWYCVNDTTSTAYLFKCLQPQIQLRYQLSNEQQIDLRSKSDAQIAEQIIGSTYKRLTNRWPKRPDIVPGMAYRYSKPRAMEFQTPLMNYVLTTVQSVDFVVGEDGYVALPPEVAALEINIGNSVYKMGIGGLHSKEKSIAHFTDDYWQLVDKDVTSYYPAIILENYYFPENLGQEFLSIFAGITGRRLKAKADGHKEIAESLKIVINGTFGKLASQWSIMYSPKTMFHVTVGGQLYLLMLIEAMEMSGIKVVSANTDGVMVKCPRHLLPDLEKIMIWWERTTGFKTEGKNYWALYSRDINNYIAIDEKGECKKKGAYANPWNDPKEPGEKKLHKNPVTTICIEAVEEYLKNGTPLEQTIFIDKDIRKFIRIQSVKDGAVKDGEYLGKSVRWYYSVNERGREIIRASNGHLIGKSTGGKPALLLPETFPDDVDYDWYLAESQKILRKIGYQPKE